MIIQNQQELDDFCAQLAACPYVAIDTEFLRDRTYFSRLCLIQMGGPGVEAAAVDPIEFDLDLDPVWDLLSNDTVLKVFHAARQDLEIFYQLTGKIPHPIFDTQVAAMVCGYGDSVAYHALVKNITGNVLNKSAQFTDWARRPLAKKQLTYALDDVIYLKEVYEKLDAELKKQDREKWVMQEMDILENPATYENHPEEAWQRIKIKSDKSEVLAILKELAAWREEQAKERNVPRGRVLKDDALADLALYMPGDVEGMRRIRNMPGDLAKGKTGEAVLELIQKARSLPKDQWPVRKKKPPFPKASIPALEMLKLLLKINCSEADVAAKLVASSSDLETLALDDSADIPALKGWRREVFGEDALALKAGKLTLGLKNGEIKKLT